MPGLYVIAGCKQEDDMLKSTVLSTCSVGYVQSFQWDRPINAFDFPMDCLTQLPGTIETDYDGMVGLLSANGNKNWWIAKIHANYKNDLDMYIRFGLLPGRVYHYWLIVPQKYYEGRSTTDENGVYADPRLWYYAEKRSFRTAIPKKNLKTIWSIFEYWTMFFAYSSIWSIGCCLCHVYIFWSYGAIDVFY